MAKTITVRVDDRTYQLIKSAAESERRTISNFVEFAAITYVENSSFVSDEEMRSINENGELLKNLNMSLEDIKRGQYRIIE
jgi:uncharacterized protein (DUF1778 family)